MFSTKFGLTATLLAVLALGANGQRGGGRGGGGDDDEPGCCYGGEEKCVAAADSKTTCERMSSRKGCEWRSGVDADCTFVVEPGCCFSATGNSKCADVDQATCEMNSKARRGGCEWRTGDAEDLCAVSPPEPGCCAAGDEDNRNAEKCLDFDAQSDCEAKPRWGCEWRAGSDAICGPTSMPTSAPVEEGLTVVCLLDHDEETTCARTVIDCPDTGTCSVTCGAHGACFETTVNCPDNYPCEITCSVSDYSCYNANFNWAETPGLGSLDCQGGDHVCQNVDFPEPDPKLLENIQCHGNMECAGATIRCPAEDDCALACVGDESCAGATLFCPERDSCMLTCVSEASCRDMNVYWPTANPLLGILDCREPTACDGVNVPFSAKEQMAFEEMSSSVAAQPASLLNESLMLLAGACAVLMTLATTFYVYGRKDKTAVASWDDDE